MPSMSHFEYLDAMFGSGGRNLYECAVCRTEYDADDEEPTILDGEKVCHDCREMCDDCGEYLDDDSIRISGPIVTFRDWALSGKLRTAHAECAATTILTYMDRSFDYDYSTREQIAALFEMAVA